MPRVFPLFMVLVLFLVTPLWGQAASLELYENGLEQAIANAAPGETLPLLIVFDEPLSTRQMLQDVQGMNLVERRAYVVRRLKQHLQNRGGKTLAWLDGEVQAGRATHLYPLWLGNGVVVHLQGERIADLAKLSGISRIRHDRPYPFEQTIDERSDQEEIDSELGMDIISWGVSRVGATDMWAQGFRGEGGLIAMIDSGVEYVHPDLIDHVWVNPGEIPDNGEDDDQNGFIDDVHGWSFFLQSGDVDDLDGHGTRSTGIAVGDGTNGDSTGVAPDAQFMVLQNYDPSGQWSSEATHFLAVQYAIDNGADVISSSMSYSRNETAGVIPDYLTARYTMEMSLAAGMIQSNSTGNTGSSIGVPWNINSPANCPPPFLHPDQTLVGGLSSILACGMYTATGVIHSQSGRGVTTWEEEEYPIEFQDYPWADGEQFGLLKPDLVGPSGVQSTSLNGTYRSFSGTSASSPSLGGSLVLLRSVHPQAPPEAIAEAIVMTAIDSGPVGFDTAYGAGEYRVNLAHDYLDNMFDYGSLHLTVTTEDGVEPQNLRAFIGEGEIEKAIHSTEATIDRILPGNYRVRVKAEGYGFAEETSVEILADATAELALELPLFDTGITPLVIDETIQPNTILSTSFTVANPYSEAQQVNLALMPSTYLDWQADTRFNIDDELGSIINQGIAWFNGHYVLAGQRASAPKFWLLDSDLTLVDSLAMPGPFATYGATGLCAVGDTLFVSRGTAWVYALDSEFTVVDSVNLSEGSSFVRGLAHDPELGHFFVSSIGGNVVHEVTRQGTLVDQYSSDYTVIGLCYYEDFFRGRSLLIVDNSQGGRGKLKSYNLAARQLRVEALLSTADQFNSSYGISLRADSTRGTWEIQTLMRDSGIDIFRREVWPSLYSLPALLSVPPGGTTFDFIFESEALPDSGTYDYLLQFTNLSDGWTQEVPVSLTLQLTDLATETGHELPVSFALHPPWPNPFNPTVNIAFDLPRNAVVTLRIVNLLGQTVAVLAEGPMNAGRHTLRWEGAEASSGLYLAVLESGSLRQHKKLILLK